MPFGRATAPRETKHPPHDGMCPCPETGPCDPFFGLAERRVSRRSRTADLTVVTGFCRDFSRRRGGRVAEGGGLLNRYTGKPVSRVRIPSSPPAPQHSSIGRRAPLWGIESAVPHVRMAAGRSRRLMPNTRARSYDKAA